MTSIAPKAKGLDEQTYVNSESINQMLDITFRPIEDDGNDIEATCLEHRPLPRDEYLCQLSDAPTLLESYGPHRPPVTRRAPGLHLDEDELGSIESHDVDLPHLAVPIARNDSHASIDEDAGREILSLRFHDLGTHRPPE